jgi:hypothetical protein
MVDVFLEREFDPPLTRADVVEIASEGGSWCFDTYRVQWLGSYLATGGKLMLCRFNAPDAEAARNAMRGEDYVALWTGSVHRAATVSEPNVAVTRRFAEPVRLAELQAREKASAKALEAHRVAPSHAFVSRDGKRMISLYDAPDVEAVRVAQREAGLPVEAVWAFEHIGPESLPKR